MITKCALAPARRRVAGLLSAACLAVLASVASAASASKAPKGATDEAIRTQIEALAKDNAPAAIDACRKLLNEKTFHQRPLAVALVLEFADAKAIAKLARDLRSDQYRDERRLLVRGLGRAEAEDALPLLEAFMKDNDALVRAAAAAALADHGRPIAIGLFVPRLPSMTDYWDIGGGGEDQVLGASIYGAIKRLNDDPFASSTAVKAWWEKNRAAITPATVIEKPDAPEQPPAVPASGRLVTPNFDLRFTPRTLDAAVAQKFELNGGESWAKFAADLETINAETREALAPLFGGTVHMPLTRIDFANDQTFGGAGGMRGYSGVATRGRITFNLDTIRDIRQWRPLVRHEYVHVVQAAQFPQMPRWLAEGMAGSIAESTDATSWTPGSIQAAGMAPLIAKGGVTETIAWQTDGNTGGTEGPRYALSHLFLDYLRFGPFTVPETRLFCLMGELNRGRPALDALQRVYGRPIAELDRGFAEWARDPAKTAPPVIRPKG